MKRSGELLEDINSKNKKQKIEDYAQFLEVN
jgi:hypothetical protein